MNPVVNRNAASRSRIRLCAIGVALLSAAGCAGLEPPTPAAAPPDASSPLGSPFSDAHLGTSAIPTPLILDQGDLGLQTTVTFDRLPTAQELYDLHLVTGLAHVVISLPGWPNEYAPIEVLMQAPAGVDMVIIVPGYPPDPGAARMWDLIGMPLRVIVIVDGPPPDVGVIRDLNNMRNLERVIARMDEPSRAGFERLQRPLSFWKVVE